jgi:hypothetical protein
MVDPDEVYGVSDLHGLDEMQQRVNDANNKAFDAGISPYEMEEVRVIDCSRLAVVVASVACFLLGFFVGVIVRWL